MHTEQITYFSTIEYNKFSFFEENREIDESWVNELVERIKNRNLLVENPIIVDSKYRVIEGQHRLKAAEKLNTPIYFIVSDKVKSSDISLLNDNRRNWKYDDYLNHYAALGKQEYIKVRSFIDEFGWITPYTAIVLSSSNARKDAGDLFKKGEFTFDEGNARLICEQLEEFAPYTKLFKDRTFIGTILKLNQVDGYEHAVMRAQIEKQAHKLSAVRTEEQCALMLEEIYNYNRPKKRWLNLSWKVKVI